MSITSSRSAKAIPRMARELVASGTPPIDPVSASTSEGSTEWTIVTTSDERFLITLPGDGRISYGRSPSRDGAEIRFYRNQSTKTYDAVIPNVLMVWSNRVTIEKAPQTTEALEREAKREREAKAFEKERMEKVAEAIVARTYLEPGGPPF
jgi:hypothetical protein